MRAPQLRQEQSAQIETINLSGNAGNEVLTFSPILPERANLLSTVDSPARPSSNDTSGSFTMVSRLDVNLKRTSAAAFCSRVCDIRLDGLESVEQQMLRAVGQGLGPTTWCWWDRLVIIFVKKRRERLNEPLLKHVVRHFTLI